MARRPYSDGLTAALIAVAFAGGMAEARSDVTGCVAAKIRVVSHLARSLAACRVPDFSGAAQYFTCLAAERTAAEAAFARADAAGPCDPSGALTAVAEVDVFIRTAADGLSAGADAPGVRCAARKLHATGRKLGKKLACHARARRAGAAVDATCLARAESVFATIFRRLEVRGGCAVTGDADAIEADVDMEVAYLIGVFFPAPCNFPGGAPACGGTCPAGTICVPASGGAACACEGAPCLAGPAPACGGACPGGGVCGADIGTFGQTCRCILPTAPCGDTYPLCGGSCPAGFTCGALAGGFGGACGCVPAGTTPCADAGFPACGGSCPAEDVCAPVSSQVGAFFAYTGCACGDDAPCETTGIVCPSGRTCTILAAAGISLRYCASPAGAFLDE